MMREIHGEGKGRWRGTYSSSQIPKNISNIFELALEGLSKPKLTDNYIRDLWEKHFSYMTKVLSDAIRCIL
jgi:hypothetical protein